MCAPNCVDDAWVIAWIACGGAAPFSAHLKRRARISGSAGPLVEGLRDARRNDRQVVGGSATRNATRNDR